MDQSKYSDYNFISNFKPKLIRDKIPMIIVENNKSCTFRKLKDYELSKAFEDKIAEEIQELQEAIKDEDFNQADEEIADLIEIYCFWRYGMSSSIEWDKIRGNVIKKQKEKGSFDKNYYLEKIDVK